MKILVTGASGFVGRHFIEHLLEVEPDAEILGVSRTPVSSVWNVAALPALRRDVFRYVQLNLLDAVELGRTLRRFEPDWVVHLAAHSSVGRSWDDPVGSFTNNTNIFLNLLEKIRDLGMRPRILSVGSSEQYGGCFSSNALCEYDELRPNNPYAVARVSQELLSKIYADSYGLDVVMTRSFNHVGPRQREAFAVPSLAARLVAAKLSGRKRIRVGDLSVVRDFVDVRDVTRAYHSLLLRGGVGEVYNVCTGVSTSLLDVVGTLQKLIGTDAELEVDPALVRPKDSPVVVGNPGKIELATGWSPKIELRDSLRDVVVAVTQNVPVAASNAVQEPA